MKLLLGQIKWRVGLAILTLGTVLSSSCILFNNYPVISSLQAEKDSVRASDSSRVECVVSDPDGDELTYLWEASDGSISGQGSAITWTAPETRDSYFVTVTVADDRGSEAIRSLSITVRKPG